ncbi:unnamed protein product [Anisakis simplex]|uniref:Uncharacterized protein n=1 Tax=Anisakis simplex TaxID=6269 RepID=A0A0M3IXZ0_ANISI|nr:unnamed protein product [Anisakis simplex]
MGEEVARDASSLEDGKKGKSKGGKERRKKQGNEEEAKDKKLHPNIRNKIQIAKKQYDEKLPESIFDLLTPKPTTTTPKPIIERLFEPFLNPIKNELNKFKEATEMTKRNHQRISEHGRLPISNDNEIVSPNVMTNSDSARRSPSKFVDDNKITSQSSYDDHEGPQIMSLLESFGQNVHKDDEMHVGRDKSVNILGMPVGRRDGLIFNPLNGISLGNQDMYGPVAINDKYNINWGFIDKIGRLIDSLSDKVIHYVF